jgi:hypothetical protein
MIRHSLMDARCQYEIARAIVKKAGLNPEDVYLTPSTLRLELQLLTTKAQYIFGVTTVNNGPAGTLFNTEVRLNQQDSFITSEIQLALGEPSSTTDATWPDHFYPSPAVFSGAGEAAALEVVYKSQLKITVNNKVVMPTLHTGRFRNVPFAQQVAAAANQNGIARDQADHSVDGMMVEVPSVVLIGSSNNLVEIDFPNAPAAVGANTRLVLMFHGLLAQNSTIIT